MSDSFDFAGRRDEQVARWVAEARRAARRGPTGQEASGGAAAPDDLAQETLTRMLEHPPRRGEAGAWIERICRNLRVDRWRAQARSRRAGDRMAGVGLPSASSGEEALLARERRRVVRRALVSLPRPLRRALILRFFATGPGQPPGWSFARVGERLGLPEATARTRVHRALVALRARVAALRVLILPQLLPLKGALALALVLAADPRVGPLGPRRVLAPADGASARAACGHGGARARGLAQAAETQRPSQAPATRAADQRDPVPAPHAARDRAATPAASPLAVQRYDYENDEVIGDFLLPGEPPPLVVTTSAAHASLIEIRADFQVEIIKTLEDL
jgi:RNA polymerase sigma-70 factor (ECF subfamily)